MFFLDYNYIFHFLITADKRCANTLRRAIDQSIVVVVVVLVHRLSPVVDLPPRVILFSYIFPLTFTDRHRRYPSPDPYPPCHRPKTRVMFYFNFLPHNARPLAGGSSAVIGRYCSRTGFILCARTLHRNTYTYTYRTHVCFFFLGAVDTATAGDAGGLSHSVLVSSHRWCSKVKTLSSAKKSDQWLGIDTETFHEKSDCIQ